MTHTRLAATLLLCLACACASGTSRPSKPLIPRLTAQQLETFASMLPAQTLYSL